MRLGIMWRCRTLSIHKYISPTYKYRYIISFIILSIVIYEFSLVCNNLEALQILRPVDYRWIGIELTPISKCNAMLYVDNEYLYLFWIIIPSAENHVGFVLYNFINVYVRVFTIEFKYIGAHTIYSTHII